MLLIKDLAEMSSYSKAQKAAYKIIGFVPTMGAFHEGHLSLMQAARQETDLVVVSLFVNPIQFAPTEDLKKYPRDLEKDFALAEQEKVDILFTPSEQAMYPQHFQTYVEVTELSKVLCGKSRPSHFRGVTTVVLKLFNIVKPDIAYFGQKDAQQAIVIMRMVKDLDLDCQIKILPTVREKNGLALSSRNIYLSKEKEERKKALILSKTLQKAQELVDLHHGNVNSIIAEMKVMLQTEPEVKLEYLEFCDLETLQPAEKVDRELLVAVAAKVGSTRLIDNTIVKPSNKC